MTSSRQPANVEVIGKIEKVFENIADSLLRGEEISIPLSYKKRASEQTSKTDNDLPTSPTSVSFPARMPQARRFTVLFRILELIHEALCNVEIISKRNIYYKDPALFKSQAIVDRYIDIIAYSFGVQRSALNVTAAAKGLVVGDFVLIHHDGTTVHRGPEETYLVDDMKDVQKLDISRVSWILVVEKEVPGFRYLTFITDELQSTFRTLASSGLHQTSSAGNGIILTVRSSSSVSNALADSPCKQGKGYPDIATRAFLHLLSKSDNLDGPPPIYCLADFDPDGMAIMSTYKHGSWNLSHENLQLLVPSIQWLGIQSSDIISNSHEEEYKGLLRLSGRDRRRTTKMLENSVFLQEGGIESEWRKELQVMLMLNVKAEMEVLGERDGGVVRWVEERLLQRGAAFSSPTWSEGLEEEEAIL